MDGSSERLEIESLCQLFGRIVDQAQLEATQAKLGLQRNRSVFTPAVVVWLMIFQRLHPNHTLSRAVAELKSGRLDHLMDECKRSREGNISGNTGAYSQARGHLPKEVALAAATCIFEHFCPPADEQLLFHGYRIFAVDGTNLHVPDTPELFAAFPPGSNQYCQSSRPIVQLVVAHDLVTGTAVIPVWGPKNGPNRTSEQGLLTELLPNLPTRSVIVGDRNFGVFSVVHALTQQHNPVVVRLTIDRVKRLLGSDPQPGISRDVTWTASAHDCRSHPEFTSNTSVKGRVIVHYFQQKETGKVIPLYLFTTLDLPDELIIELYQRRWFLETDLCMLKSIVNMQELTATKVDLVEKEIILGVAAYNLVRSIITVAAQRLNINPRHISFSRALEAIEANAQSLFYESDSERLDKLLDDFKYYKIYRAKHKPSEPRSVKPQKRKYPILLVPREVARNNLKSKN